MAASIAFIKKALFDDVKRKFAVIKEQFINERDSLTASHKLMKSHITKNMKDLYYLSIQCNDLKSLLYLNVGIVLVSKLINIPQKLLSKRRYLSFETKNQKIIKLNKKKVNLIKQKQKPCNTNYSLPIINLSNYNLSNKVRQQLKIGLDYFSVEKSKDF